ncbi:hypothetical protein F3Y22_tig00112230pilonHSYRG00161 [Hibiscus syriacus]|uniref:Reverse transcriptase RNase H-like domain-containing protein n=1 Tax=Hibiscus syriacus TaxID=106335 RepID=A0A6A2XRV6_HIBSY|nr:hypothetical protein F3Y22_tig00112230pilonHSYRG00161 [Hibiscus syriacus]
MTRMKISVYTCVVADCYSLHLSLDLEAPGVTQQTDVDTTLSEFADVFEVPTGLPPTRKHDHIIHQHPSSEPVNVRPYRYPYYQKQEIDRQLKQCLCSATLLGLLDINCEFIVETDASGFGIGTVLHQGGKPIAFYSQKFSLRVQAASTHHKEMFSITQAVGKWQQYLLGRRFSIITDQRPLREVNQQTIQTPEQLRWLSKLIGYNFDIKYRPGKLNVVADALSREAVASYMNLSRPLFRVLEDNRLASVHNHHLTELRHQLQAGHPERKGYSIQGGLVVFQGKIMVPAEVALCTLLL